MGQGRPRRGHQGLKQQCTESIEIKTPPAGGVFCTRALVQAALRSGHIAASPSASVAETVVRIMWRG